MSVLTYHTNTKSGNSSMGSGILPIAEHNGRIYFLFGKECYLSADNGWSDFGGRTENNEGSMFGAIREGYEETSGFLGDYNEIKNLVMNNTIATIESTNYKTFLFQIDYCEKLPVYYNKNFEFVSNNINKIIGKNGYHEKEKIKWFTYNELKQNIKLFRCFYQPFLKIIINNFNDISQQLK